MLQYPPTHPDCSCSCFLFSFQEESFFCPDENQKYGKVGLFLRTIKWVLRYLVKCLAWHLPSEMNYQSTFFVALMTVLYPWHWGPDVSAKWCKQQGWIIYPWEVGSRTKIPKFSMALEEPNFLKIQPQRVQCRVCLFLEFSCSALNMSVPQIHPPQK